MKRKWMLPAGMAGLSLIAWIAFGVAVLLKADRSTLLVLLTIAALTIEGVIWTAAAVLGVSAFQARREIWNRLRAAFRRT